MKTLKQLFKEISLKEDEKSPGQTSGTPGQGNWSVSKADLSKNFDDNPAQVQQMKASGKQQLSSLMKQLATIITPDALSTMSQDDVNLLLQRVQQHIDTTDFQAEKIRKQIAQEPGTNVGAKSPARTDTRPIVPAPANQDQTPGKKNKIA